MLWLDEMEKGFSGTGSSNMSDGGTTSRVFGTFVTWMQEKSSPVFVIATANDVRALPPELLRKGRFDEIFFVDLPTMEERAEILKIHLSKKKRAIDTLDMHRLIEAMPDFSGSEVEQVVVGALYEAFDANRTSATCRPSSFCTEPKRSCRWPSPCRKRSPTCASGPAPGLAPPR